MTNAPAAGPVEWVALTFPGPALDPRVVPPLRQIVEPGTVRLLDAVVLHNDQAGGVTAGELQDEHVEAFDSVDGEVLELLSEDDLAAVAAALRPDSTTLVLVWENLWAATFGEAIRQAGGELAAYDRISRDRLEAAFGRPGMDGDPDTPPGTGQPSSQGGAP
ncbi:DUF6325 family protein [Actinotalea sp. K2]|uniref:DUF6325 family protein n=1 Tax=Actinotalea sp. K2 TaxID=2939438 RepID=UPI00201748DE|nr:DUF6325 family protein [Actinotalea sp. K2]MCL3861908.1 DUF6325 family protein [Actinotalea sp. K2]